MSASAYANLILGVQFTIDELYTEQQTSNKECPIHGVQNNSFTYCPMCSKRLGLVKTSVYSPGFSSLAARYGQKEKGLLSLLKNHEHSSNLGIWEKPDANTKELVLGINIGFESYWYTRAEAIITIDRIQSEKEDLEKLLTILGFHNKEIQLHLFVDLST
jgi:hypothetical protein